MTYMYNEDKKALLFGCDDFVAFVVDTPPRRDMTLRSDTNKLCIFTQNTKVNISLFT